MNATMTDNHHAKLSVWLNADKFDKDGGYDLYTECKYHPVCNTYIKLFNILLYYQVRKVGGTKKK